MDRYVLWWRGEGEKSLAETKALLPDGAIIVDNRVTGIYLVEGSDEYTLRKAFPREAGWTLAPEQFGYTP